MRLVLPSPSLGGGGGGSCGSPDVIPTQLVMVHRGITQGHGLGQQHGLGQRPGASLISLGKHIPS